MIDVAVGVDHSADRAVAEVLVDQVVHQIVALTGATVQQLDGVREQVVFRLPQELRGAPV